MLTMRALRRAGGAAVLRAGALLALVYFALSALSLALALFGTY